MCGIGGNYEIDVAKKYASLKNKKPIVALIIDGFELTSKTMIDTSESMCYGLLNASEKKEVLEDAGIIVVDTIQALKDELKKIC